MVTTTDLISYWDFDEASGDLLDLEGSNDGTVSGADYGATGIIDDCYDFANSSDKVTFDTTSMLYGETEFSISLWFNSDDAAISKSLIGDFDGSDLSFLLRTSDFLYDIGGSGFSVWNFDEGTFNSSTWYHYVITYESGTGLKLYKNGALQDSSGTISGSVKVRGSGNNIAIGNDISGTTNNFTGRIDEACVFHRVLSLSDVQDLYNSGDGLAYPFTSDVTVSPSAVALSLSATSPTYLIDISTGAVPLIINVPTPNISVPIIYNSSVVALTLSVLSPTISKDVIGLVGSGTIGSKYIATRYPVTEGLIAGTTKQTGNPNLVATEEGTW